MYLLDNYLNWYQNAFRAVHPEKKYRISRRNEKLFTVPNGGAVNTHNTLNNIMGNYLYNTG